MVDKADAKWCVSVSTCHSTVFDRSRTLVAFGYRSLLFVLQAFFGGQLGSSVDLGWAHLHVELDFFC